MDILGFLLLDLLPAAFHATSRLVLPYLSLGRMETVPVFSGSTVCRPFATRRHGGTVVLGTAWAVLAGLALWIAATALLRAL
ncbi:hypothetical protein [Methylobacterium oryzihabitans]|uniref:Uncharacterized protein n=1 Tax=Methylobacterium oryzihabitans TaxID=2499852 RepID=A0A3S2XSK5_9HYPH|nr:hypothetical protein [Methylobacterium oryzihabitans]RVU21909.1 hypothetical protein EOE48_02365 [Methylobacterium oryzihabitans]